MKYELGGRIMTEFARLRPKTYSYLTGNNNENKKKKKTKGRKKCFLKQKLKSEDYKHFQKQLVLIIKQANQKKMKLMWIVLEKIINNL